LLPNPLQLSRPPLPCLDTVVDDSIDSTKISFFLRVGIHVIKLSIQGIYGQSEFDHRHDQSMDS